MMKYTTLNLEGIPLSILLLRAFQKNYEILDIDSTTGYLSGQVGWVVVQSHNLFKLNCSWCWGCVGARLGFWQLYLGFRTFSVAVYQKPLIWINLALTVTLLPTTTYGVISAIILSLFFSSELPLANISCCELEVQEETESHWQAD